MDFLEEEFDEILKIFSIESDEIITRLNNNLLALEKKPASKELMLLLFRDAHSLKGAARMIGFVNVQTIAHKIEDILGLAKENELTLNTERINAILKSIDCISDIIHKSLGQKKEIYSQDFQKQIEILENINNMATSVVSTEFDGDYDSGLLKTEALTINTLIVDTLYYLMNIETNSNESFISELLDVVKRLYTIFEQIGIFEPKQVFEDIKVKLEFVSRGSNTLTISESEEILEKLNSVISELCSVYENHSIETVDYYGLVFERPAPGLSPKEADLPEEIIESNVSDTTIEPASNPEIIEVSNVEPEIVFENVDFEGIKEKISTLVQNCDFLPQLKEELVKIRSNSADDGVEKVVKTISKLLDFISEKQINLDEDSVQAIQGGFEFCDNVLNNRDLVADKDLVLQQLEILQKVLEFKEEDKKNYSVVEKSRLKVSDRKIKDFSKIFDTGEIKTLRVDSTKLDGLVNQVGELITTKIKTKKHLHELNTINKNIEEWQRNSLKALNYLKYCDKKYFSQVDVNENPIAFFVKQLLSIFSDNNKNFQELTAGISALYRNINEDDMKMGLIIDELEHMVKNVRVLPLATIFHLFGRMVRDIAQEKNKQIELEIIGSETSADKKIIEEIKTPLIHIIRNAIDHGIETPQERLDMGKNPVGKIVLKAYPSGNNIVIEIQDDGRGINIEKIKEKALAKGYLRQEEIDSMSNEELTNIIFAPGFSTGDEITSISGRGIGMDVVQSKISQLNGRVKVISEMNKGCCVQIELPTTMSTMKAFLVNCSDKIFAIPMSSINTVVWKRADEIFSNKNNTTIVFNEKTIPVYYLADVLKMERKAQEQTRETILIIENENKTIGLAVDKLVGDQEILHKKLAAPLYKIKNISGLTTLASGEICLILNLSDMLKTLSSSSVSRLQQNDKPEKVIQKTAEYKILIVDDSMTTRTLEKNILTKVGYKIETAINPLDAFEKMKYTKFDLIISDIEMPEMTGLEFLAKLKTDEMYSDIPVIMVSSLFAEEYKQQASKLGAKAYIVKGEFKQEELLSRVKEILF